MSGTSALVTGAHGFVGRHVAKMLKSESCYVIGLGHGAWSRAEYADWGVDEWHCADVTLESLKTYGGHPEMIVHCAGSGSVPYSVSNPYEDYQRSVGSMIAVLEYVRTSTPHARLVVPSSAAVYGVAAEMPISIGAPRIAVSPYGVHKKIAEDLCFSYARHFGVRVGIVRFFSVFGIGLRKQILWDACGKMQVGDTKFHGTGRETRDFIHIDDATSLVRDLLNVASSDCPVVNGGNGVAVEIRSLLDVIAGTMGVSEVTFTGVGRLGDPVHYQADISEATKLGWHAQPNWRDEVVAYANWVKAGAK